MPKNTNIIYVPLDASQLFFFGRKERLREGKGRYHAARVCIEQVEYTEINGFLRF
jgi:hypothetical protein